MDEAGLQVGGSFLLGVRIICALFALWAAEVIGLVGLLGNTGESGRAVSSLWIKKPPAGPPCLSQLRPGSCQADGLLLAPWDAGPHCSFSGASTSPGQ